MILKLEKAKSMKNLFLIPTPAETRIAVKSDGTLFLTNHSYPNSPNFANHNIYITNDEDIENKGYAIYENKVVQIIGQDRYEYRIQAKDTLGYTPIKTCKKIIMTSDPELIKKGVQPIPDEFLEWLVLNPTCEFVKTIFLPQNDYQNPYLISIDMETKDAKQIIPKEDEGDFCHYSGLPSPAAYVEKSIDDGWLSPMQRFKLREDKPNVILVGSGLPPAKLTLELTQKEARALLNCLSRTFAKGTDLDFTEPIEEKLLEFLKPLEK